MKLWTNVRVSTKYCQKRFTAFFTCLGIQQDTEQSLDEQTKDLSPGRENKATASYNELYMEIRA